ncbi:MAG TPA: branched-chain amino acid ABC transporter permease [Thermomicrobiales bacterium]|nr:branched-chain amino acid ABC transporter permease [Thermomicrobiales bacterium]
MDATNLIQAILWGLANGAVLALVALGYTLVYGIIELINFAHGDLFMMGSFVSLTLLVNLAYTKTARGGRGALAVHGIPLVLLVVGVLLAAMVFCAVLNVAIERLAYRPLRRAPRLAPLISAIGVSFTLINLGQLWKGSVPQDFPDLVPNVNILDKWLHLTDKVSFTTKDLMAIGVAVPLMLGLAAFIQRTKLGRAMRATAQDREAAALMGINIDLTISLTFLLGGALAGAAGLIYGLYTLQVWYLQGFRNGLIAFTAAVLGGIGNVRGAAIGGFLIGLVASISDLGFAAIFPSLQHLPVLSALTGLDQKWTIVVIFAALILTLIFRPSGLMGEEVAEKA